MSNFDVNEPYKSPTSASQPMVDGVYPEQERTWALAAHLSPLLNFVIPIPFFSIIAPLIVWFLKRETMPLVDDQAKEAVNFQITVTLIGVVCGILVLVFIGILLLPLLLVYTVIMSVLAAKAAQEGKHYRYPFTLRLL
jgi:hypothetical protein